MFGNHDETLGRGVVIADNEFDQWTMSGVSLLGSHLEAGGGGPHALLGAGRTRTNLSSP